MNCLLSTSLFSLRRRVPPGLLAAALLAGATVWTCASVRSAEPADLAPGVDPPSVERPDGDAEKSNANSDASSDAPAERGRTPRERNTVSIQQMVEPAFKVTPMLHTFESRRGKQHAFEFEIESLGQPTTIEVRAVALRQEENGVIMPDDDGPSPDAVQLDFEGRRTLVAGDKVLLKGKVKTPLSDANFHTFGILVKDLGRDFGQPEGQPPATGPDGQPVSRAGVRFVTQYLCRCDITVLGARGGDIQKLIVEQADIVDDEGRAKAQVWINNPTDSQFLFEVRCQLRDPLAGAERRPFSVVLPVRASLEAPERFNTKILAHSRIRLEEFVPDPVFTGEHQIVAEVLHGRRSVSRGEFAVNVDESRFPAQEILVARAAPGVMVSPAQAELSLARGGARTVTLTVSNTGDAAADVAFTARDSRGEPAPGVAIRPAEVSLPAGASRKVQLSLSGAEDLLQPLYGAVDIVVSRDDAVVEETHSLRLAVLGRTPGEAELIVSNMRWEPSGARPAFVATVENRGARHGALNGTLQLSGEDSGQVTVRAGFGKWLLPGETADLRFPLPGIPTPGSYQLVAEIDSGKPESPLVINELIKFDAGPQSAQAADGGDAAKAQ